MAAEVREATGEEPELIAGSRGIFDVAVDGRLVFSKYETERFPEPGEIASLLR